MNHIFILNPFAGSGDGIEMLKSAVENANEKCEIYETKGPRDATEYIRKYCEQNNAPVRFYACGGDGTVKEVAEGVRGFSHASMSVFPIGSGNDFVKYFGGAEYFTSLDSIMKATAEDIDIIHMTNEENDTYSLNVCNFGFEAYAANAMNKVRRKPIIGGKNAYTTGIFSALLKAMKAKAKIYADGELLNESGVYLLCTAANGGFVGGGYNCAPRASVNDGFLEVCFVRPLSIFSFIFS